MPSGCLPSYPPPPPLPSDASIFSCPGTTIEAGEGMTHFVPISEGCPLHQSTIQLDIAGQDLTLYLLQLLSAGGHPLLGTGRILPSPWDLTPFLAAQPTALEVPSHS